MRHGFRAIAVVSLALLSLSGGCGDDSGGDRLLSVDCFADSPQAAPTRDEIEEFARLELPPSARVVERDCEGFMDTFLSARITMDRRDLRRFIAAAGLSREPERGAHPIGPEGIQALGGPPVVPERVLGHDEFRKGLGRNLVIDLDQPGQATVYLQAFTT